MRKNKQLIPIVLSLFIFLSGMCLESVHADAMAFCVNKEETIFLNIYSSVPHVEARAEELSRGRYNVTTLRAVNQPVQVRRSMRVVYELLCKVDTARASDQLYLTEENLALIMQEPGTVVTNYIHDTDGKKRI